MNSSNTLSVIAIILSVVAIILAWVAYNRTGVDFEEVIQREVSESLEDVNANIQGLEEAARNSAAEGLRESAEEVNTDEDEEDMGTTTP